MASTSARFESSGFVPVGTIKTVVCVAPVDNKDALHHYTVDDCQTMCNYPSIFKQLQ
jgi:hypothetical protein